MKINCGTNLHCPKCGNDIISIIKTVSVDSVIKDNRPLKCYWPKCGWEGKHCDVIQKYIKREGATC